MDLKQRLQETCNIAQEELLKAQEIHKKQYDKSARPKVLEDGQKVLLLLPTKANKLLIIVILIHIIISRLLSYVRFLLIVAPFTLSCS